MGIMLDLVFVCPFWLDLVFLLICTVHVRLDLLFSLPFDLFPRFFFVFVIGSSGSLVRTVRFRSCFRRSVLGAAVLLYFLLPALFALCFVSP